MPRTVNDLFHRLANRTARGVGSPWAFFVACLVIIAWAVTGPFFQFSNTWQLVINTGTTIVTFLMVFLIQNTQNRDTQATQLKLNEIIHALKDARDDMIDIEDLSDEELEHLHEEFSKLRPHPHAHRVGKELHRRRGGMPKGGQR